MATNKKRIISLILLLLVVITSCFTGFEMPVKAKAANNDIVLKLEVVNEWSDGRNNFTQVNGQIINNGNAELNDWKIHLPISANAVIDQSWCGTYIIQENTLTITPDSGNAVIRGKSNITFGFIVKNAGVLMLNEASLLYEGYEVDPTNTPTPIVTVPPTSMPTTTPTPTVTIKPTPTSVVTITPIPTATPTPVVIITPTPSITSIPQQGKKDWLYTDGSRIYDIDGKEVWLTGVNWFGYNTGTNIFDGVWSCDLDETIHEIANRGFNLLRVPISSELLLDWKAGKYPKPCYNDYVNKYLANMNSLQIFDHVVQVCKDNGIKIMMDIHCATNAVAHYYPVWFTPDLSEEKYIESLTWMANRYKDDDTIVAVDLKNEPHGKANDSIRAIWNDSNDQYNWKYIATKAANAVLSINPNLLIVVEGIEIYPMDLTNNSDFHSTNFKEYYGTWWGGNLRGVKDYPINLGQYQNKLVYSPHDYGPSVFQQTWFEGNYTMDSLYRDCWHDNWFYIQEENIAPLLIGEWGGFMTEPNLTWMTYLRDFIIKNRINHTFWCFNANSGDTGGLVYHDFTTWDEAKYEFLKPALWQKGGRFVGLDHDIPLGDNGMTLSEY